MRQQKLKLPPKHAVIVFLLWAFAPAAWYLLWRDEKYHSWFPKLLWVNGIIFSVILITQSFVFIPKLNELYEAFDINLPTGITPAALLLTLSFVLLQIPAGMHIQKKIEKHKYLTDKYVIPILIIFAIDGVIALSTGVVSAIQSPTALVDKYFVEKKLEQRTPNTMYFIDPETRLYESPLPTPTPKPISLHKESSGL